MEELVALAGEIRACVRCDRLRAYLRESRERFPDYWSLPVPGFGDPRARLYILGLAPGLHGANRHGRVFTGDDSGRWLWGALHELGACDTPNITRGDQPATLTGVYVSNAVRCVPPRNRPTTEELNVCRSFLARELEAMPTVTVVLALGKLAHDTYLKLRREPLARHPFRHGGRYSVGGPALHSSYHPSRQNTHTGVLTREMWLDVIREALGRSREDMPPG